MKIVHLCLNGPFTEGWGYQENLLAKYHALAGHEVTVIAGQESHLPSGRIVQVPCGEKTIENGVRLIRVPKNPKGLSFVRKIFARHDVLPLLQKIQPDLVMIHGMVGDVSALQVKRYVGMGASARVVMDIHQDQNNTLLPRSAFKRTMLRTLHRLVNGRMYPLCRRIYYVAPSCGALARAYYAVPEQKLSFLPLGCDTELSESIDRETALGKVRPELGFSRDDILILHGGKLDEKKRTLDVIEAVKAVHQENARVKLVVFGAAAPEYQKQLDDALKGTEAFIKFFGYCPPESYYRLMKSSDIAVFPGSRSALWQQAASCALALMVPGTDEDRYLDRGGNVLFLQSGGAKDIADALRKAIKDDAYVAMQQAALLKAVPFFSYKALAQRVIGEAMQ